MISYRDLQDYRSLAAARFVELPNRPQLPGVPAVGFWHEDLAALAQLDAALTILGRLDLLNEKGRDFKLFER